MIEKIVLPLPELLPEHGLLHSVKSTRTQNTVQEATLGSSTICAAVDPLVNDSKIEIQLEKSKIQLSIYRLIQLEK